MSKRFSKIYVEITNMCNLNCSFCSRDLLSKKEMSPAEFKVIIDRIKKYTDNIYLHVKGEPLLHSQLDEILGICDNSGLNVRITTNGTLLSKKKNILKKHYIKQLNISLHSENDIENYFEQVFSSCDELNSGTSIIYRIWTIDELGEKKLSPIIVDNLKKHYKLSTDIVDKINKEKNIKIKDNIYIDKDYKFEWPTMNVKKRDKGTCLGTKTHVAILCNGTVTPCCLDSNGIIKLGNIFENDFEEILNSDLFKKINIGFSNYNLIHDLCKSCTYNYRFDKR